MRTESRWLLGLLPLALFASCSSQDVKNDVARTPSAEDTVFSNPAFESVPAHVKAAAKEIFAFRRSTERTYRPADPNDVKQTEGKAIDGSPAVRRDTHAKTHACTKAEFTVRSDVPSEYRVGLFANPGENFKAWVRFANGLGAIKPDLLGDARAMSIKVMGVQGPGRKMVLESFADEERFTQDFVMNNGPTFFLDGAKDAHEFFKAEAEGKIKDHFKGAFNPTTETQRRKMLFNALLLASKPEPNLLTASYWSGTPYHFGSRGIVKYVARPCADKSFDKHKGFPSLNVDEKELLKQQQSFLKGYSPLYGNSDYDQLYTYQVAGFLKNAYSVSGLNDSYKDKLNSNNQNYLRDNISSDLSEGREGCFDFGVETYADENSTPIEKPTVYWKTQTQWLARVTIGQQSGIADANRIAYCDGLSFNPWHALKEHKPAGELNAVRGLVYKSMTTHRHQQNQIKFGEPLPNYEHTYATPEQAAQFYR